MSPSLPPLTERIDRGAAGGQEFERLLHQLLLRYADHENFEYQPRSGHGGDAGVDGAAPSGKVPGIVGAVSFQFKWLYGEIHKGNKAEQIKDSLRRAIGGSSLENWVLITPWDLTPKEKQWLNQLPTSLTAASREPPLRLRIHHWGREKVESILRLCPSLFARYFPHEASALLKDFSGFDFREFARDYRQKVALDHRKLLTIGIPPEALSHRDATKEIRLRDVFVEPILLPEAAGRAMGLAELLNSGKSCTVLGDPGAGKSTLMAFLALVYSDGARLQGHAAPPQCTPFLIRLGEYARLLQDRPGFSFLDFLQGRARSDYGLTHAHVAFFESALRMGEAIVLLDGLDEVGGEPMRHRIANAIASFHHEFPTCQFWATSRIYGYTPNVRLPFSTLRLSRLESNQVDDFIDRWYIAQWPNNERERVELTSSLRRAVSRSPQVRLLTGNPLLLTLMAIIHQGLRRLPQDRGELYDKCIEMLLNTWQEAKRGDQRGDRDHEIALHIYTQKDYLAHLALYAQERYQNTGDSVRGAIPRGEALECLARRHLERSSRTRPSLSLGEAREEMERFVEYLADRTGLLVDRGGGKMAFIHLSFQEYLAAWVFTTRSGGAPAEFFLRHIGSQSWEEVLLLRLYIVLRSPGGGGEQAFDLIIRTVLDALERDDAPQKWLTLARAIRDNLEFSESDLAPIIERAVQYWLRDATVTSTWFNVLEDVSLYTGRPREALREYLVGLLMTVDKKEASAVVHLLKRLFGEVATADGLRLAEREDASELGDDLVALGSEASLAKILTNLDFHRWLSGLSVIDSRGSYRLSIRAALGEDLPLGEAGMAASLALLLRKTCREVCSRAELTVVFFEKSYEAFKAVSAPYALRFNAPSHECVVPVGSLLARPFAALGFARLMGSVGGQGDLSCRELAVDVVGLVGGGAAERSWCEAGWLVRLCQLEDGANHDPQGFGVVAPMVAEWVTMFGRSFEAAAARELASAADGFSRHFVEVAVRGASNVDEELRAKLAGVRLRTGNILGPESLGKGALVEQSTFSLGVTPRRGRSEARIGTAAIPVVLAQLWAGAVANQAVAFARESLVIGAVGGSVDAEAWLAQHPVEVHLVALAWEEHARVYAAGNRILEGVRGALMLAHAAYARLMTGLPLDGPIWRGLVEERSREEPLLEATYWLYEVCRLGRAQEGVARLAEIVRGQHATAIPVLEAAGFSTRAADDVGRAVGRARVGAASFIEGPKAMGSSCVETQRPRPL